MARLDFVVFYLLAGRPMDMYETGVIDVSPVNAAYIDKVRDEAGPFYQDLVVVPQLSFYFIGFNSSKPPFDDANIRLAFSMALDRDKLVSLVYKDTVEPAAGILPPGLPGYNDDLTGITYDVDRARQLIADSAYGDVSNLPPITLTAIGWGGLIAQELEAIISQWRTNLGVEVKVRQLEPERYLYYLKQEKDELFYMGWIADYPHPQNFLEVLFHSQADNNWADYSNPELDALLEMAAVETDGELSLELYQQAEQMIIEDAACWPFQFGQNYILVKPYVKGYYLSPLGLPILSGVTIEPH
ncbi:Dipeptide-binding protein DppE [subsurface metagenome]